MLWSVRFRFCLLFLIPSVFFQAHQLHVVLLLPLYSTTFSALWKDTNICLSFCFLSFMLCGTQFFFHVIYPFGLSVMFFLSSYRSVEVFCFLCIRLFIGLCAFSNDLLVEFSFVILEGPILFQYCSIDWLCRYLLSLSCFVNILWYISSSCIVLSAVVFFRSFYSILSLCIFPFFVLLLVVSLFVFFSLIFPSRFCISVLVP